MGLKSVNAEEPVIPVVTGQGGYTGSTKCLHKRKCSVFVPGHKEKDNRVLCHTAMLCGNPGVIIGRLDSDLGS